MYQQQRNEAKCEFDGDPNITEARTKVDSRILSSKSGGFSQLEQIVVVFECCLHTNFLQAVQINVIVVFRQLLHRPRLRSERGSVSAA